MQEIMEKGNEISEELVERILRRLHIGGNLSGFYLLVDAVKETAMDRTKVRMITKELYPEVAQRFGTRAANVERCIRTIVGVIWSSDEGRRALDEMAGYHLTKRPTNSEFVDLVAAYIRFLVISPV